jgi:hypothetical protein
MTRYKLAITFEDDPIPIRGYFTEHELLSEDWRAASEDAGREMDPSLSGDKLRAVECAVRRLLGTRTARSVAEIEILGEV